MNSSFALRNEKIIVLIVAVLTLLGIRAYLVTSQSIFPPMSFPRIDVVMDVGDLPPDQVSAAVVRPFEATFQELPSATRVKTTASQGSAEFVIDFAQHTDPRADLQYVNQATSQLQSSVPLARNITAVIVNPNSEPVLSYAVTAQGMSAAAVREYTLLHIVQHFYGIPGMGRILVSGGPTAEYHVILDPAKLRAHGLTVTAVVQHISETNTVQAVGSIERYYQRYAVIVDAGLHDLPSLSALGVPLKDGTSLPLSAIAEVRQGVSPLTNQTSFDGKHAILINVYALPNADTVRLAAEFQSRLASVQRTLPAPLRITNFWDQTTLITASQAALRDAIIIGAILAIIVIYAFLRDLRLVMIAALVIPLAMAIAIFALQQTGQTLNLMSVGGLAVAVGLIIDDAIVVIENISRNHQAAGDTPITTIISDSMKQITGAMIASTMTTVVVFLPLSLLSGVSGFFFRALAFTLSASLIVSLLLALLLAPIVARRLLGNTSHVEQKHDALSAIFDRYDGVLRWGLSHRFFVACGSALTLAVTVALLATIQSDFLPSMDEGQFEIAYTMPSGTALAASDAAATTMEHIVSADPAVASVGRLTALDSNGISPAQTNQGALRVRLTSPAKRDSYDVVSERIRGRLEAAVPSSLFDVHQILEDIINDLSGTASPIAITVSGDDQATLIRLATQLASRLQSVHGIVDTSSGVVYDDPSLRIVPNIDALAALGLSYNDVVDQASSITQGIIATNISHANVLIPVRVTVRPQASLEANLAHFALVSPSRLSSNISTVNGQRVMTVTANISGASLSNVTQGIRGVLRSMPMPAGYAAVIGGEIATQQESFTGFLSVIAIAIVLVYAVMLGTFRSFRLPLVILTAIPLALIGVALALRLTATAFNVSSFMGLLLLVGIVVKNGILLIDVANRQRAAGCSITDALVAAGKTRLRPIVMTTLAAIGGLFPLALGIGQGAEMEKPLAIAVIGGLSTATIFTLIVIPVLYATFFRDDPKRTSESMAQS